MNEWMNVSGMQTMLRLNPNRLEFRFVRSLNQVSWLYSAVTI